jgi:hypothetical protein
VLRRDADSKPSDGAVGMVPRSAGVLTQMTDPEQLHHGSPMRTVEFYGAEFARTGFRGALN